MSERLKNKSDVPQAYLDFLREEGIPGQLHRDKAKQYELFELDDINIITYKVQTKEIYW